MGNVKCLDVTLQKIALLPEPLVSGLSLGCNQKAGNPVLYPEGVKDLAWGFNLRYPRKNRLAL